MEYNLITILGPTASGKTSLAAKLAGDISGEIISADSRQVYKEMDLGTGKDYADYQTKNGFIPYHLIDMYPAGYKYNVFEFRKDFLNAFVDILNRGKTPLMVGGTGMYLESVLNNYELIRVPENNLLRSELINRSQAELVKILSSYGSDLHNTSDSIIRERTLRAIEIAEYYRKHKKSYVALPPIRSLIFGINMDRDIRREKISTRLKQRLDGGMIDEVKGLLTKISPDDLIFYGLEYKFITLYLMGKLSYEEMYTQLEIAIHQFSKRQMTWFRRMERNGCNIFWLDGQESSEIKIDICMKIIEREWPHLLS